MQMIDLFLKTNKDLCNKCKCYLPQAQTNIFQLYNEYIIQYMNIRCNQIVVDAGGGRSCSFAKHKALHKNTQIISVDISEEQLKYNYDVDKKIVADIMRGLPFRNEKVDLLVSKSVLEHLEKLENFIIHSSRVLKKNGCCIHLFPSKFAPFSLINQLLPKNISKKLLYFLKPKSRGFCGFPSFYNKCFYSAIKSLFEKHGFEIVDVHLSYYQSPYFDFFVPLYLFSAIYDIILQIVGAKNLCAYILVVAKKL